MKKIALILCLVLVASFVLSGCNNSDSSLPEEQQLAISAVPPDLLEESGLVKTEDAEVSAQEDELCGYPLAPEEVE